MYFNLLDFIKEAAIRPNSQIEFRFQEAAQVNNIMPFNLSGPRLPFYQMSSEW